MYKIIEVIEIIIPVLISVAFLTLGERKVLGSMQRRKGPEKVGLRGLLQPFADALKLIVKEGILPTRTNKKLYILAPIITLILSIFMWVVLPINLGIFISDEELGLLLILSISSLAVYGIIYSGWSSNSRYGMIGSLRSVAQIISYEVSIGIILMELIIINNSFNLTEIYKSQIFIINGIALLPILIIFIISALAETNRHPFDLVEAESELVAGTLVEYSSTAFVGLYLAEYTNILAMSSLTSILFFGSSVASFATLFITFLFIWIRGTLPRLRYDQLMNLGWTKILPFSISYLILTYSIFLFFL